MTRALCPEFTNAETRKSAEEDWLEDAEGKVEMSYTQFFEAMFRLVDLWCLGLNSAEYVDFLDKLYKKISIRAADKIQRKVVKVVKAAERKQQQHQQPKFGTPQQHPSVQIAPVQQPPTPQAVVLSPTSVGETTTPVATSVHAAAAGGDEGAVNTSFMRPGFSMSDSFVSVISADAMTPDKPHHPALSLSEMTRVSLLSALEQERGGEVKDDDILLLSDDEIDAELEADDDLRELDWMNPLGASSDEHVDFNRTRKFSRDGAHTPLFALTTEEAQENSPPRKSLRGGMRGAESPSKGVRFQEDPPRRDSTSGGIIRRASIAPRPRRGSSAIQLPAQVSAANVTSGLPKLRSFVGFLTSKAASAAMLGSPVADGASFARVLAQQMRDASARSSLSAAAATPVSTIAASATSTVSADSTASATTGDSAGVPPSGAQFDVTEASAAAAAAAAPDDDDETAQQKTGYQDEGRTASVLSHLSRPDEEILRKETLPKVARKRSIQLKRIVKAMKISGMARLAATRQLKRAHTFLAQYKPVMKKLELPANMQQPTQTEVDAYDSEEELMSQAERVPLTAIIVGKPGSGKTTTARALAMTLGITHVTPEDALDRELKSGSELGKQLDATLRQGGVVSGDAVIQCVRNMILDKHTAYTGYILDGFPETTSEFELVFNGIPLPSRVIELTAPDSDCLYRTSSRRADRAALKLDSTPLPPKSSEDGGEEAAEAEEEGPVLPGGFWPVRQPEDDRDAAQAGLLTYRQFAERLSPLLAPIPKVFVSACQPTAKIVQTIQMRLKATSSVAPVVRIAAPEEGDEEKPAGTASQFAGFDAVEFASSGKLVAGTRQFVAQYLGREWLFSTEANLNEFIANPSGFANKAPAAPNQRICILGPAGSGKSTQARLLMEQFGWRMVEVDGILQELEEDDELDDTLIQHLSSGGTVPTDMYVRLVSATTGEPIIPKPEPPKPKPAPAPARGKKPVAPPPPPPEEPAEEVEVPPPPAATLRPAPQYGWVLDNFPRTAQQAAALTEVKIFPDRIIVLTDEGGEVGEQLQPIIDVFTKVGVVINTVPAIGVPLNTVAGAIRAIVDPFAAKAVTSTLPEDEPEEEQEEDAPPPPPKLPVNKKLGDVKTYSPVSLINAGVLAPGDPAIVANYKGYNYLFVDEEEQQLFLANPALYANTESVYVPPMPHIAFVGVSASGKTEQAERLSTTYGMPVVDVLALVQQYADENTDLGQRVRAAIAESEGAENVDGELVAEVLEDELKKQRYKEEGWILDGYPKTAEQIEPLLKRRIYPDIVVNLQIDNKRYIQRLEKPVAIEEGDLDEEEEEYPKDFTQVQITLAKRAKVEAKLTEKREAQYDELRGKRQEQIEASEAILAAFTEKRVPVCTVNGNVREPVVFSKVNSSILPFVQDRDALLTSAVAISPEAAEAYLASGEKSLSRFGRRCIIQQLTKPLARFGTLPILYRHHIYFAFSEEERAKFIASPLKYIGQPLPLPPILPHVVVVGPPKSGKSTLCEALSKQLGVVHLSGTEILRRTIASDSQLGRVVDRALHRGDQVTDEQLNKCLLQVLDTYDCLTQGWVLDGYPMTLTQSLLMEKAGIAPHNVFVLELDEAGILARSRAEHDLIARKGETPRLDADAIQLERLKLYNQSAETLHTHYRDQYRNVIQLNGMNSKWALQDSVLTVIDETITNRKQYALSLEKPIAANLKYCGVTPDVFKQRLSHLGNFDAVSLSNEELVPVSDVMQYAVSYLGQIFPLASERHIKMFLNQPQDYAAWVLPTVLPTVVAADQLPRDVKPELHGFCPVTYASFSNKEQGLVEGSKKFAVKYDNMYFFLASEHRLNEFMRTPWQFHSLPLPDEKPKPPPIKLRKAPIAEYLDRTVTKIVTEAMQRAAELRPKYPYATLEESALKFMGLHLKATNKLLAPRLQEWFHERYERFIDISQLARQLSDGDESVAVTFDSAAQIGVADFANVAVDLSVIRKPEIKVMSARRMSRRVGVSAETGVQGVSRVKTRRGSKAIGLGTDKQAEQRRAIQKTLQSNILFRNLDGESLLAVIDALEMKSFKPNEVVIRQGDDGDLFYIISEGDFEIRKDNADGKGPVRLGVIGVGMAFGELALMYNMPRAATIRAIGDGPHSCWVTDRNTFRSVLMGCFTEQRELYQSFLDKVDLFRDHMDEYDRARLTDAFESVDFDDGAVVVKEGEPGDAFYVIESGEATVSKSGTTPRPENSLHEGQYFGELSLLSEGPRAATVTAKGPLRVARLDADAFKRLIPDEIRAIMQDVASSYASLDADDDAVPRIRIKRRVGVSAETEMDDSDAGPVFHEKSDQERESIARMLRANLLFKDLAGEHLGYVIDSMYKCEFDDSTVVMTQGDDGDLFYLIEAGAFDVLRDDGEGPQLMTTKQPGDCFGELALMYNMPRSATVCTAASGKPHVCWVTDRTTFRTVLMRCFMEEREKYSGFLDKVDLFSEHMQPFDRARLADAFEQRQYKAGEVVVHEGEKGDAFFVIESGEASVSKSGATPRTVNVLTEGQYFGELALLNDDPRAATVTAETALKVAVLSAEAFERLIPEDVRDRMREASASYSSEPVPIVLSRFTRRIAVSAEADAGDESGADTARSFQAKEPADVAKIQEALSNNLLFKGLDQEAISAVIDAMYKCDFKDGDFVIKQGDDGNAFYVVEAGNYIAWKDSGDGKGPQRVAAITAGGCFGELALMYNMPRAASIKASGPGPHLCWAVDRKTFRRVLMRCFTDQRAKYEGFLDKIDLFRDHMSLEDIGRLADAFEALEFKPGETIVHQGEKGDAFYVIESGEANVVKDGATPRTVNSLTAGQYFGELALLTDDPRAATVIAETAMKVSRLSAEAFERLIPDDVRQSMQEACAEYNSGGDSAPAPPPRFKRRVGVSAETDVGAESGEDTQRSYHPKEPEEVEILSKVLSSNILFKGLDQDAITAVIDSMYKCRFEDGDFVITQGEDGNAFYVVQTGDYIALKDLEDGKGPVQVATIGSGGSFGELALMYNMPRAASIKAVGSAEHICWATDRKTFRNVLMRCFMEQREKYEGFLDKVDLFRDHMNPMDRARLSDAFETREFQPGDVIVRQGDRGDAFYVIESGEAKVVKDGATPRTVNNLSEGQYFGELALLNDDPRAATVIAETAMKVAVLSADAFERLIPDEVRAGMQEAAADYGSGVPARPVPQFKRRVGVSAETDNIGDNATPAERVFHEKELDEIEVIDGVLRNNMLFKDLDQEHLSAVIDSMYKCTFNDGDVVIEQGDDGDAFYVVQSGEFGVWKDMDDGKGSQRVGTIPSGGSFGELAVMYNMPRAATIRAIGAGPHICWATDRHTFRSVLMECFTEQRARYESFLDRVALFRDHMNTYDRARLTEAFEAQEFANGEFVVKQGDVGDAFYVIESGEAVVLKNGEEVNLLTVGNYFGELALLTQEPRAASVQASGKLKVARLTADAFERLIPDDVRATMQTEALSYNSTPTPRAQQRRRVGVSAEADQDDDTEAQAAPVVIPKTPVERSQIAGVLARNLLFRELEMEHMNAVIDSMAKCEFHDGDVVIQQGDDGDAFYVVQEGTFPVFKDNDDGKGPVQVTVVPAGGSFGELALMYNMPRAATVKAAGAGPHVCWATDRTTFRRVLMKCFTEQRAKHEGFLDQVALFKEHMNPYDRARLSDAFEAKEFTDGQKIVTQGEQGDAFYVIEAGEAAVIKNDQEVNHLKVGSYFGELALLKHEPRAASVVALGKLKVAKLPADAFERLIPQTVRRTMQEAADSAYAVATPRTKAQQ
eukprot:TRINITY_DN210_c0_g1_i2.p1 TRINITY_DN210_c0_g1~~TRINITY_DN210_c0_g1_i2.p1  ORF type:complete len:3780 (+),score=1127.00 TRINITY_DN210_c0_g1_i2:350-11689(+)